MEKKLSNQEFSSKMSNDLKSYGLSVLKFCDLLPNHPVTKYLQGQLIRSGTSCGANYRAALRAKSKADFIYKLQIVVEEPDESLYFLELFQEYFSEEAVDSSELRANGEALLKIIVKSINTIKS